MPPGLSDLVLDTQIRVEFHQSAHHRFSLEPISGRGRYTRRRENQHIWTKERLLGDGSFGDVYLHRCSTMREEHQLQAVKTIDKARMASNNINYHKEIEAIAKFSQPKYRGLFVQFLGWYENEKSVFIAMEYIEDGDLSSHLTKPLPEAEARTITFQVAEGLMFLHSNSFVHRDVKPKNIFVIHTGPEWHVKLGDFGISKRINENTSICSFVGTRLFMAPEVQGFLPPGEEDNSVAYHFTESIDMWSLGVTTYFLLFHDYPFSLKQVNKLSRYVAGDDFPFPASTSHEISPDCYQFIEAVMGRHPRNRLSSKEALESKWLSQIYADISEEPPIVNDANKEVSHDKTEIASASADPKPVKVLESSPTTSGCHAIVSDTSDESTGGNSTIRAPQNDQSLGSSTISSDPKLESSLPPHLLSSSSSSSEDESCEEELPPNRTDDTISSQRSRKGKKPRETFAKNEVSTHQRYSHSSTSAFGHEHKPPSKRHLATRQRSSQQPYEAPPVKVAAPATEYTPVFSPSSQAQENWKTEQELLLAESLYLTGSARLQEENYDAAESFHQQAFDKQKVILGMEAEATLETCFSLGRIFYEKEEFEKAASFLKLSAEGKKEILSPHHPGTLLSFYWLGCAHFRNKKFQESEDILKRVVTDETIVFGPNSPETLHAIYMLGHSLYSQQKWLKAKKNFQVVATRRWEVSRPTLSHYIQYSVFYSGLSSFRLGHDDETVHAFQWLTTIQSTVPILSRLAMIEMGHKLGDSLVRLKRYDDAIPALKGAIALATPAEAMHRDILDAVFLLGRCYMRQKEYAKALYSFHKAAEAQKRLLGPADIDTLESLYRMGQMEQELGFYTPAEKTFERIKDTALEAFGPDQPMTLDATFQCGVSQYRLRKFAQAEESLQAALAGRTNSKSYGPKNSDTLDVLYWISRTQRDMNMLDAAEATCHKSLVLETEVYGSPRPSTLNNLHKLTLLHHEKSDYEKAHELGQLLLQGWVGREGETGSHVPLAKKLLSNIDISMRQAKDTERKDWILKIASEAAKLSVQQNAMLEQEKGRSRKSERSRRERTGSRRAGSDARNGV